MRANNDEGREPWPQLAPPLGSRIRAASNSELDTNEVNQLVDTEDERSYIYGVGDAVIQVSVPSHVAEQIFAELP